MEKTKLVCLADSVGTNYKMRVRTNTFSELLARRLKLEAHNYATPGATSGYLLGYLNENEEIINNVKDSKVVLIACGTNNVLTKGLVIMGKAAGLDVTSWRLLPKVVDTIKNNPVKALQMVTALNSKQSIENIMKGVDAYKQDMPVVIEKIRELNPDAIIMIMGIYTMSDISKSLVYKVTTSSQAHIAENINTWLKENMPQNDVIVLDIAQKFREYHGDKELSNLNENDIHLSDEGHLFVYRNLYELLTSAHPDLATEETMDVIHIRKIQERKENITQETKNEKIIREIITRAVNRDEFVYDINKQFDEMGVNLMEMLDITRSIENECFDGHEVIDIPTYNFAVNITPRFYIDILDGKAKDSALLHLDEIKHYESDKQKKEALDSDTDVFRMLRESTYKYLKDDMIEISKDTSFFNDLKMNVIDYSFIVVDIETKIGHPLPQARKQGYENMTFGKLASLIVTNN